MSGTMIQLANLYQGLIQELKPFTFLQNIYSNPSH